MKSLTCKSCGQEHPAYEMFEIAEQLLCNTCADKFLDEHPHTSDTEVRRYVDQSVCVNCGAENSDSPHELFMQIPTCSKCIDFFRNRPFPAWIKVSFAALVVLIIFSMGWNWRFFQGHSEMKAALQAMEQDNFEEAVAQMSSAANHVPESMEIRELSMYLHGLENLKEEKMQSALDCFNSCPHLPPDYQIPFLIHQAEASLAFDQKDYDRLLQTSEENAKERPSDPIAQAQIASALACKYAVNGDLNIKLLAESKLEEAKSLGLDSDKSSLYEERIRHRLATREVIDSKEFIRRFPNGWKQPKDNK